MGLIHSLDLFYEMLHRQEKEPEDRVAYDSVEDFLDAKTEIARLLLPLVVRALEPGVERRLYALPDYVSTEDEWDELTVENEALEQLSEDEAVKQCTPLKGDLLPVRRQITCQEDARPINPQVLFI